MKKHFLKIKTAIGLLVLIGIFLSCNGGNNNREKLKNIAQKEKSIKKVALISRDPIVFITGYDKNNSNYYKNASAYFEGENYQIINDNFSLEEIILWMNKNATKKPYGDIHIVNYNTPFKGMNLETVINGDKITTESLQKNSIKKIVPNLNEVINTKTKFIFYTNELGKNTALLKNLKQVFTTNEVPQIAASPYFNIFGGQFTKHYLAKPYYVFYPTANSPGMVDLSKEIAKKYPEQKDIDWFSALTNETERYIGEPYTQRFNIPVRWELDYSHSDEAIPTFVMQEEIMDFVANDEGLTKEMKTLNIPIQKFRWTYKIKNNKLIIKGKTTVLCLLKPLTKPYGNLKHIKPDINNKRLYAIK